jgi:hypothetical protein
MPETINPYAPPKAEVADVVPTAGEEAAIRQDHIKTEASIRSIGILYYLCSGLLLFLAVSFLAGGDPRKFDTSFPVVGSSLLTLALGLLGIFIGRGIRNLRPWARVAVIMLASLGCIVGVARLSLGIVVQVYILYLLFSKKGRRIFASDYPDIVAATPEIKYRTSIVIWILLGLVVLLILAALVPMALQK